MAGGEGVCWRGERGCVGGGRGGVMDHSRGVHYVGDRRSW
jgi:hypothetical protein